VRSSISSKAQTFAETLSCDKRPLHMVNHTTHSGISRI
jgi:hypothetical protein